MCFSYDAGCHIILYVTLSSNTFTDWRLISSCFFLCWPFNSLELFSSSSQWLFCYPVDHFCTRLSSRIAEVIIWFSFSVFLQKLRTAGFHCGAGIKLVLRWLGLFVSLYSFVSVHWPLTLSYTELSHASGVTVVNPAALTDVSQCWDWDKKFSSVIYNLLDLRRRCFKESLCCSNDQDYRCLLILHAFVDFIMWILLCILQISGVCSLQYICNLLFCSH